MDHKNLVVKSKSSNTAMSSKQTYTTTNKKSWSSARFGYTKSRKRGVYVEKKTMNAVAPQVAQGPSDVPKAPKRPRRGEKTFLAHCLSILSQDTTATQFPEVDAPHAKTKKNIAEKPVAETVDIGAQDLDAIYSASNSPVLNRHASRRRSPQVRAPPSPPPRPRKPRFRSKALSENFNDFYVIKPKKPIPQTSSASSHHTASKTALEARLKLDRDEPPAPQVEDKTEIKEEERKVYPDDERSVSTKESKKIKKVQIEENDPKQTASEHNEVEPIQSKKSSKLLLEKNEQQAASTGLRHEDVKSAASTGSKKVKKVSIEEPSTLVGDYNSKNKSLYNLFVDLLETTFNVYNVESEYVNPPNPTIGIEEKAAYKLKKSMSKEKTDAQYFNNAAPSRSYEARKKLYYVADDGVTDRIAVYQAKPNCCSWNPPAVAPKKSPFRTDFRMGSRKTFQGTEGYDYRPTLKSQSFRYAQQLKIAAAAKAERPNTPKKRVTYKKNSKQNLLNILKEELKMDADYFEEPENLHQALAKIARDRKRTRKLIRFDETSGMGSAADKRSSEPGKSDCFKRHKVISSSTKSPRALPRKKMTFMESLKTSALPRKYSMTVYNERSPGKRLDSYDEPSYHSIEVRAYDYEPNQYVRRMDLVNNALIYTSNSGVSLRSETGMSSKDLIKCTDKSSKRLSRQSSESLAASTTISQLLLRDVYNMY